MFPSEKIYTDPFHPQLIIHRVEGGTFMMGGADEDAGPEEKPVHSVQVSTFYIGKFTVTQSLWQKVMGNNPANIKGDDNRPVENVSWMDIVNDFLPKLKAETKLDYRLPTEAEWEFAARGGIQSVGYLYAGSDKLKQVGWYDENSDNQTHPIGEKMANELGLQDMSGNVWEWCADHYGSEYYRWCKNQGTVIDPQGTKQGTYRVLHGGSYSYATRHCRSSFRSRSSPDNCYDRYGFRLALPSSPSGCAEWSRLSVAKPQSILGERQERHVFMGERMKRSAGVWNLLISAEQARYLVF